MIGPTRLSDLLYNTRISGSCSEEEGNIAVKVHKKFKVANPLVQSVSTINILKVQTLISFYSQIKCWLSGLEFTTYNCQDSKQRRP